MKPSVELAPPTLELKKRLVGRGAGGTSSRASDRGAVALERSSSTEKQRKAIPEHLLFFFKKGGGKGV